MIRIALLAWEDGGIGQPRVKIHIALRCHNTLSSVAGPNCGILKGAVHLGHRDLGVHRVHVRAEMPGKRSRLWGGLCVDTCCGICLNITTGMKLTNVLTGVLNVAVVEVAGPLLKEKQSGIVLSC